MNERYLSRSPFLAKATTILTAFSLLWGVFAVAAASERSTALATRLTEDQKIIHVLNRLGFGARPGDVEKVRKMGLSRYIDQQLHPEQVNDQLAESKVKDLSSYWMTTAQLYEKYPQPGQLLKALQRKGDLPADLAAAAKDRVKGNPAGAADKGGEMSEQRTTNAKSDGQSDVAAMAANQNPQVGPAAGKDEEYRKAVRQYYLDNNLQPPQRITQELQASRIMRAVYSERQLNEQLVDFWSNHFNIFANKGADRWMLVSYDRDTIRPHVLGKFQDLLVATAESPAMLFYLDNFQSVSPNAQAVGGGRRALLNGGVGAGRQGINRGSDARAAQRDPLMESIRQQRIREMQNQQGAAAKPKNQNAQKRGINENYARELMELHTLGVDGGYTQKDVQEVARCFTGWTIFAPRAASALRGANLPQEMIDRAGSFYFNPRLHDDGEKTVLGHKIPAGGGVKDGLMVLDILAHHPSTAKFISTKLARYFVSDNPSPEFVARVAGVFQKSDGDIRETLRAIFDSPEFNSPVAYRAKIKTPFELAVSAIRALGGDTNGGPALHQWIQKMGEPLYGYQAPTGYPDNAENWVNTGALLERLNFGIALASNKIPGTRVDISKYAGGVAPNSAAEKTRVMNLFIDVILQGDITDKTRISLTKQFDQPLAVSPPAASNSADATMDMSMRGRRQQQAFLARNNAPVTNPEAVKIAGLILGSPEFQRQ